MSEPRELPVEMQTMEQRMRELDAQHARDEETIRELTRDNEAHIQGCDVRDKLIAEDAAKLKQAKETIRELRERIPTFAVTCSRCYMNLPWTHHASQKRENEKKDIYSISVVPCPTCTCGRGTEAAPQADPEKPCDFSSERECQGLWKHLAESVTEIEYAVKSLQANEGTRLTAPALIDLEKRIAEMEEHVLKLETTHLNFEGERDAVIERVAALEAEVKECGPRIATLNTHRMEQEAVLGHRLSSVEREAGTCFIRTQDAFRAIEGLQAEVKKLAQALVDMREDQGSLNLATETDIRKGKERIEAIEKAIGGLRNDVDALKENPAPEKPQASPLHDEKFVQELPLDSGAQIAHADRKPCDVCGGRVWWMRDGSPWAHHCMHCQPPPAPEKAQEEPRPHDTDEGMEELPAGCTCFDCAHFKPKCSWLLGGCPDIAKHTSCSWNPSRFHLKPWPVVEEFPKPAPENPQEPKTQFLPCVSGPWKTGEPPRKGYLLGVWNGSTETGQYCMFVTWDERNKFFYVPWLGQLSRAYRDPDWWTEVQLPNEALQQAQSPAPVSSSAPEKAHSPESVPAPSGVEYVQGPFYAMKEDVDALAAKIAALPQVGTVASEVNDALADYVGPIRDKVDALAGKVDTLVTWLDQLTKGYVPVIAYKVDGREYRMCWATILMESVENASKLSKALAALPDEIRKIVAEEIVKRGITMVGLDVYPPLPPDTCPRIVPYAPPATIDPNPFRVPGAPTVITCQDTPAEEGRGEA